MKETYDNLLIHTKSQDELYQCDIFMGIWKW